MGSSEKENGVTTLPFDILEMRGLDFSRNGVGCFELIENEAIPNHGFEEIGIGHFAESMKAVRGIRDGDQEFGVKIRSVRNRLPIAPSPVPAGGEPEDQCDQVSGQTWHSKTNA